VFFFTEAKERGPLNTNKLGFF